MGLYAFDGTWQHSKSDTNVTKFKSAYTGERPFYAEGAGTLLGTRVWDPFVLIFHLLGLFGGLGDPRTMRNAYAKLCKEWMAGDHDIDIVGYSRGAASALEFACHVDREGIRDPNSGQQVEKSPTIRFLGLWDTVFFIMDTLTLDEADRLKTILVRYPPLQRLFSKKLIDESGSADFRVPKIVKNTFHALALNEQRRSFKPVRLDKVNAHEVWFVGKHGDIGGQTEAKQLSEISLCWMIKKAESCGVSIQPCEYPPINANDTALSKLKWGSWKRDVREKDLMHFSVPHFARETPESISFLVVEPNDG